MCSLWSLLNYRIANDNKIMHKESFYSLLFLLLNLNFYFLVNNVRNVFAFSLICYAVFRELYLKKRDALTIFLYVIPCFMHASAILLVLFRIILPFTKKIKWVLLVLIISMKFVVGYLSGFLGGIASGNVVVQLIVSMLDKGNRYYNNYDSAWAMAVHSSGSMKLASVFMLLFFGDFFDSINANIIFIYLIAYLANALLPDYYYRGIEDMKITSIRTVAIRVIFTLLIFVCVKSEKDYIFVPISFLIGSICALVFSILDIKIRYKISYNLPKMNSIKVFFKNSIPFFISRFASTFYQALNVIILGKIYGNSPIVGYYTSSILIGSLFI